MPGAVEHVHPVVGVPGVHEDLVVLLEPGVELVPVEGDVSLESRSVSGRLRVAPGRVLDLTIADLQVPALGLTSIAGVQGVARRLQQVHPHVAGGEVINHQAARLEHEQGVLAVCDRLARDKRAHATSGLLHSDPGAVDGRVGVGFDDPVFEGCGGIHLKVYNQASGPVLPHQGRQPSGADPGGGREQQPAQDRLLRLDRVRRQAQRLDRRIARNAAGAGKALRACGDRRHGVFFLLLSRTCGAPDHRERRVCHFESSVTTDNPVDIVCVVGVWPCNRGA